MITSMVMIVCDYTTCLPTEDSPIATLEKIVTKKNQNIILIVTYEYVNKGCCEDLSFNRR